MTSHKLPNYTILNHWSKNFLQSKKQFWYQHILVNHMPILVYLRQPDRLMYRSGLNLYLCHADNIVFIWAAAGWCRDGSRSTSVIITNMMFPDDPHIVAVCSDCRKQNHTLIPLFTVQVWILPDSSRDFEGPNLCDQEPDTHFPFLQMKAHYHEITK